MAFAIQDCSVFFCDFSDSFKTTTITTYLWKENSQNFAIQFFCQLEEMWHFERSITSYCRKTSLVSKFKGFNFNACTVLNWWKIVSCYVVCYQFRYSFFFYRGSYMVLFDRAKKIRNAGHRESPDAWQGFKE